MSEPMRAWTAAQFAAHKVIVGHQQDDAFTCTCGWHEFGGCYADHLVHELTKAGVFGGPRQHDGIDGMLRDLGTDFDGTPAVARPLTVNELVALTHPEWTPDRVAVEAARIVEGD